MVKQKFELGFKKLVIEFMEHGKTAYETAIHFGKLHKIHYNHTMFLQWFKNREKIKSGSSNMLRVKGGGRKTSLGTLEEILFDEILELRVLKVKVTRTFIADRAVVLAAENNIEPKATGNLISGFLSRNGLSLRRATNFTILSDDKLLHHAMTYMNYLQYMLPKLELSKTLLMDETAVYFEDARTQTVDIIGRKHIIMKSTGFASMRITAALSVWADGKKALPLIIHKGKDTNIIKKIANVLSVTQSKAWVNQELIISWIDYMFPSFDVSSGKCIIWDSCRAHISLKVKEHCRNRKITLFVIPGGLTPYLQAGDIGIFREFKDKISILINSWKNSNHVEYTRGGSPKQPSQQLVNSWVSNAWNDVSHANIQNSIKATGFSSNINDWHISKHDIYGERFIAQFLQSQLITIDENEITENNEFDVFDIIDE